MPRDNWHNEAPLYPVRRLLVSLLLRHLTTRLQYASSAPTTHRDALFARVLDKAHTLYARGAGVVGVMPWAYGGVWRPETQRFSTHGVVWAGDPMHEGQWASSAAAH